MVEITAQLVSEINVKLNEVEGKAIAYLNLSRDDSKDLDTARKKLGRHVQKLLKANSDSAGDVTLALQNLRNQAQTFLQMQSHLERLEEVGAKTTELKGLVKFSERLEKSVFTVLGINPEEITETENTNE